MHLGLGRKKSDLHIVFARRLQLLKIAMLMKTMMDKNQSNEYDKRGTMSRSNDVSSLRLKFICENRYSSFSFLVKKW